MNNRIQMTEEQARGIIECIFGTAFGFVENDGTVYIQRLRENGYIIKSELQQKVEEAEEMYRIYDEEPATEFDRLYPHNSDVSAVLIEVIRDMKKDHPEFKK